MERTFGAQHRISFDFGYTLSMLWAKGWKSSAIFGSRMSVSLASARNLEE